jgi:alpha-glucosidase
VPLPWSGSHPPYGFSPDGVEPWLPQPASWAGLTVEAQGADPDSMLSLHRHALRVRHDEPALRSDELAWRDAPPGVLDFDRGDAVRCVVNLSDEPYDVGPGWRVLVGSEPLEGGGLPVDAAVWLARSDG